MKVKLYARIRQLAGAREVEIPAAAGDSVGEVLQRLVERYPKLDDAIWAADGSLAGHVAVLLDGRDVRHLKGEDTPIRDGQTLSVFPPVGGGSVDDEITQVRLKFANHFRARIGKSEVMFSFPGTTLRDFVEALLREYEVSDLLLQGEELKPHARIVINGRFSDVLGGWEAKIAEGSTIVLLQSYVLAF